MAVSSPPRLVGYGVVESYVTLAETVGQPWGDPPEKETLIAYFEAHSLNSR